jgi:hypothetical protein
MHTAHASDAAHMRCMLSSCVLTSCVLPYVCTLQQYIFWIGPLVGSVLAITLWEVILRPPIEIASTETKQSR